MSLFLFHDSAEPLDPRRASPPDEPVELWWKGQVWKGLKRSDMLRYPGAAPPPQPAPRENAKTKIAMRAGTFPARVFDRRSQMVGGSTIARLPGGQLAWQPTDPRATQRGIHAIVRLLLLNEPIPSDERDTVELARQWGFLK